jgi:hypothetical protein
MALKIYIPKVVSATAGIAPRNNFSDWRGTFARKMLSKGGFVRSSEHISIEANREAVYLRNVMRRREKTVSLRKPEQSEEALIGVERVLVLCKACRGFSFLLQVHSKQFRLRCQRNHEVQQGASFDQPDGVATGS